MFFGNILQFSYQKNDQNGDDFAKKSCLGVVVPNANSGRKFISEFKESQP